MAASKKKTEGHAEAVANAFEIRRKAVKLGECCPVFDAIIKRDVSREQRRGFEIAIPFMRMSGKPQPEVMIYRFPKALKGAIEEPGMKGVTYALVAFCPFCGAPQTREVAVEAKKTLT